MRKALRELARRDADIVQEALRVEHENRMGAFRNLQAQGHVSVMNDERPDVIRVRVDEEFFTDSREDFPTSHLMARLQLAIAAGQTDRNASGRDSHTMDAFQYGAMAHEQHGKVYKPDLYFMDEMVDYKTGGDYLHGDVTATVKRKFRKGLRP